eukprot:11863940-Prorocentrum_lima.AAC.1
MMSPSAAIITHLNLSWFWFACRNADLLNAVTTGPAVVVNDLSIACVCNCCWPQARGIHGVRSLAPNDPLW